VTETMWDAPNQQVVRGDQSAPWDEGHGGSPPQEPPPQEPELPETETEPEQEPGQEPPPPPSPEPPPVQEPDDGGEG
jgi:hypothetical protein